ncbi:MAG: type II toxin-antitoxin system HigB family toxin [Terracidiphilus sp.]
MKLQDRSASIISAERVVFNVKCNDFRPIAAVNYEHRIVLIVWLGTHREYDRIGPGSPSRRSAMRIRPIRTEADYDAAVARIAELMGAKTGTAAGDELDVLATLVDAYESRRFPIHAPDPVAIVKFQMEQQGLSRKDLEPMIGSRARVSEVLNGKRALTLPMIRRLNAGLHIPVDLLVGTPTASRTRRKGKKTLRATLRSGRHIAARVNPR